MTPIHPLWQTTDGEEPVTVRVSASAPQTKHMSRTPAAIVGITVMVGLVTYTFGGLDGLIGQLTNPTPDVTVRITHSGTEPSIATIAPGQTIRWINDDQIPHILSSDTLPTGDGKPFNTVAMFPASDAYYTAPLTAPEGLYDYISQTSPEVAGQIIISTAALSVPTSSTATVTSSASSVVPTQSATSQPTTTLPTQVPPSPPSSNALEGNVIAVNPYVVGTKPGSTRKPGVSEHTPMQNAESGPTIWIAGACAIMAAILTTKRLLKTI